MAIGEFGGQPPPWGLIALVLTAAFAWRHGGGAERLGASWLLIGGILAVLLHPLLGASINALPFLWEAIDAVGLVLVAVRYSSLWLGPALMIYSGGFALHAVRLGAVDPQPVPADAFPWLHDVLSYLVQAVLAAGTVAAMRRRGRRSVVKAAPPPSAACAEAR